MLFLYGIMIALVLVILGEKLQLIEIVQLALVGFIAISLLIFLFSYVGYRSKTKKTDLDFKPEVEINPTIKPVLKVKLPEQEPRISDQPVPKTEVIESNKVESKKDKFEVFKPSPEKSKIHNPKIIISDITKETGKKIN
jgi:hypothetical protein